MEYKSKWPTDHGDGTEQRRVVRVDCQRFLEVELGENKLLLLVVHHSYAIPTHAHVHTVMMMLRRL